MDAAEAVALVVTQPPTLSEATRAALAEWPSLVEPYSGDDYVYTVRGQEMHTQLRRTTLSGSSVPRVALPRTTDHGELVRFLRAENLPGRFPFTAGVFPVKREGEAPARMFAGEGDPFRTNRRFHLLAAGQPATRLSTAFDSVTLYGRDPGPSPDVYGKVGTSGVSIATLDDMRDLYGGFDLCSPIDLGVHDDQRPGADAPRDVPRTPSRTSRLRLSPSRGPRGPPTRSARRS